MNRAIGELDDAPASLAAIGGSDAFLRQLIAAIPEAFIVPAIAAGTDAPVMRHLEVLATETVDDWWRTAATIGETVALIGLCQRATNGRGLDQEERSSLAAAYAAMAGSRPRPDLSPAEIAERMRPLLSRRIEHELVDAQAWPVRRGAPWGLYVRALAAAWAELNGSATPGPCATPGCVNAVPATRNRLYCGECQTVRRSASVRRSRSRATARARSG